MSGLSSYEEDRGVEGNGKDRVKVLEDKHPKKEMKARMKALMKGSARTAAHSKRRLFKGISSVFGSREGSSQELSDNSSLESSMPEAPEGNSKEYYQNLSLEEKRRFYKCGEGFVTLEDIEVWSKTRKDIFHTLPEKMRCSPLSSAPSLDDKVSLWQGDITRLEVDAIVNSANCSLLGGGGIDGAVHRAAGPSLHDECLALKGCPTGQTKLTSGHRLPAKYILHTVCPNVDTDERRGMLESCYNTSLELVLEHKIRSVAFCCMATGVYDYPRDGAAEVALDVTRKWLENHSDKVDRIIFCTYNEKDFKIYQQKLCKFFPPVTESEDSYDMITFDDGKVSQSSEDVASEESDSETEHCSVECVGDDLQTELAQLQTKVHTQVAKLQNQVGELIRKTQRYADALARKDEIIEENEAQIAALRFSLDAALTDRDKTIRAHQFKMAELQHHLDVLTEPLCVRPETWSVPRAEIEQLHKEQIGVGAWGTVYSAKFRGKDVAIKIAHPQIHHQLTIELLKREVTIMSCMQHPNLVRFIAAVWDEAVERREDSPIIVSELMDTSLRSAYEQGMDLSDSLISIFCDVAYALHYLHQQRQPVIHRDVSAPNILLKSLPGGSYRAKLSDFGSANLIRQCHTTGAGAIIYCAPEMFPTEDVTAAPQPQTTKVDVFSFGILLLEAVCREMPTQLSRRRMLQKVEGEWEEMSSLIVHCIRPSPSDRPTMTDILDKLNSMHVPNKC